MRPLADSRSHGEKASGSDARQRGLFFSGKGGSERACRYGVLRFRASSLSLSVLKARLQRNTTAVAAEVAALMTPTLPLLKLETPKSRESGQEQEHEKAHEKEDAEKQREKEAAAAPGGKHVSGEDSFCVRCQNSTVKRLLCEGASAVLNLDLRLPQGCLIGVPPAPSSVRGDPLTPTEKTDTGADETTRAPDSAFPSIQERSALVEAAIVMLLKVRNSKERTRRSQRRPQASSSKVSGLRERLLSVLFSEERKGARRRPAR